MDRRSFIARGTVGTAGLAAGTSGCAPVLAGASGRPGVSPELAEYLDRFDRGTSRLDAWPLAQSFADLPADPARLDDLGKSSIKALYTTGMFGDLSIEQQLHPAVQERIWGAQPAIDGAVAGVTELLIRQTPEESELLRRGLRERPDVAARLADVVDEQAALSGLSAARRAQFRTQVDHVAWRLEHQPPQLIVEEYITKVRKVSSIDVESAARQRWLAARVGEEVFWQEAEEGLRQRRISKGLRSMGIGGIILGVSGVILLISSDGVAAAVGLVGATVGSIFLIIGLVRILMGLATSHDAP